MNFSTNCGWKDRGCRTARRCLRCLTLHERVSVRSLVTRNALKLATELSIRPDLIRRLVPPHAEPALREKGIDIDGFVPIPLEQLRISLDVSWYLGDLHMTC